MTDIEQVARIMNWTPSINGHWWYLLSDEDDTAMVAGTGGLTDSGLRAIEDVLLEAEWTPSKRNGAFIWHSEHNFPVGKRRDTREAAAIAALIAHKGAK